MFKDHIHAIIIYSFMLFSFVVTSCEDSSPTNPANIVNKSLKEISSLNYQTGLVFDIEVKANYAYLADIDNGLRIIDFSDTLAPEEKFIYGINDRPMHVFNKDNYLFLSGIEISGIDIIDISNPISPNKIANIDIRPTIEDIFFQDTLMFIAVQDSDFMVYSINDVLNPVHISTFKGNEESWFRGIDIIDQTAYIANDYFGFRILDISDLNSIQEISLTFLGGEPVKDIEVHENIVYMANGDQGLAVYNILNLNNPTKFSTFQLDSMDLYRVKFENGICYAIDLNNAFLALNLNSPTNPQLIDSFQKSGAVYDFFICGEFIFLAAGYDGFILLKFD